MLIFVCFGVHGWKPPSWKICWGVGVRSEYSWFPVYVLLCSGVRFYPGVEGFARSIGKQLSQDSSCLRQENIGIVVILIAIAFILHSIQLTLKFVEFKDEYREIFLGNNPVRLTIKEIFQFVSYVAVGIFSVGWTFVWLTALEEAIYSSLFYYYLSVLVCFLMAGSVAGIVKLLPLLRLCFR